MTAMDPTSLHRISDHEWEIPRTFRDDMRGPVRIFATREILERVQDDRSLEQAVSAATLPGLVGSVVVMPDLHQGYGFPIGGIAATEWPHGVISPGAIGYDINCGVRLLVSTLKFDAVRERLPNLADRLYSNCPSGVGKPGTVPLNVREMDRILEEGAFRALSRGYADSADLETTEESGQLAEANPSFVSERAKARGRKQLGSLGAGNHFLEIDMVDEIFDPIAASAYGLLPGCLAVQIHCGSRGLGHQVCTDYVERFQAAAGKYGIAISDRQLACAPMDSPDGEAYLGAMRAAANFGFANRQILAHSVRRAFEDTLSERGLDWELHQVYDVAHNMGKLEEHEVEGRLLKVCVHRKGATRAVGPGSQDLPLRYLASGQPVLVPGSMGTTSWVLAAAEGSLQRSWGSCCHGAGRVWSRARAKREIHGAYLRSRLEAAGILVRAGSLAGLAEEAPAAYKDVGAVVEVVVAAGIARKVARLKPLAVIKG